MSALVLFTDKILHIALLKDVYVRGKWCSAKYSDGKKYASRVLAVSNSTQTLDDIKCIIDDTADEIEEVWIPVNDKKLTFAQVLKAVKTSATPLSSTDHVLFVHHNLLLGAVTDAQPNAFTNKDILCGQPNFFKETSQFVELRKENDTIVSEVSEIEEREQNQEAAKKSLATMQDDSALCHVDSANSNKESWTELQIQDGTEIFQLNCPQIKSNLPTVPEIQSGTKKEQSTAPQIPDNVDSTLLISVQSIKVKDQNDVASFSISSIDSEKVSLLESDIRNNSTICQIKSFVSMDNPHKVAEELIDLEVKQSITLEVLDSDCPSDRNLNLSAGESPTPARVQHPGTSPQPESYISEKEQQIRFRTLEDISISEHMSSRLTDNPSQITEIQTDFRDMQSIALQISDVNGCHPCIKSESSAEESPTSPRIETKVALSQLNTGSEEGPPTAIRTPDFPISINTSPKLADQLTTVAMIDASFEQVKSTSPDVPDNVHSSQRNLNLSAGESLAEARIQDDSTSPQPKSYGLEEEQLAAFDLKAKIMIFEDKSAKLTENADMAADTQDHDTSSQIISAEQKKPTGVRNFCYSTLNFTQSAEKPQLIAEDHDLSQLIWTNSEKDLDSDVIADNQQMDINIQNETYTLEMSKLDVMEMSVDISTIQNEYADSNMTIVDETFDVMTENNNEMYVITSSSSENNAHNFAINPFACNISMKNTELSQITTNKQSCPSIDSEYQLGIKKKPKIISNISVDLPHYKKSTDLPIKNALLDTTINLDNMEDPVQHSTFNEPDRQGEVDMESGIEPGTSEDDGEGSEASDSADNDWNPGADEDYLSAVDEDDEADISIEGHRAERNMKSVLKSLNISVSDSKTSAPDDRELQVESSTSSSKQHFCMYCKTFQSKIARHLEQAHCTEEEVKKFIILPPRNKERKEIIATIRKHGDYIYNTNRQFNKGTLIVCRRPSSRTKRAEDFAVCGNCKGQYTKSVIRHHSRRCQKLNGKRERMVLVTGKKIAARVHEKANADVRKHIFPYMQEDEIVRTIRYDELLILFGNKQCDKYGSQQHLYQMIRQRLRLVGRLLVVMKNISPVVSNFTDIYQPRCYDNVIESVKVVAKFDQTKKRFEHPAVASQLGTLLKQIGELLRSECIKREVPDEKKKVEDFLNLLSEDYGVSINRAVTETQTQNYRRKKIILPSSDDVTTLYTFIVAERNKYFNELNEKYSFHAWKNLAKTTLTYLQIFNRRRPGEIERLCIEDFQSYHSIDTMADKETFNALTEEGKTLAKTYVRLEIRGKLGRGVPVLIDKRVFSCLELLIKHRQNAGVPDHNRYLFALPSDDEDRPRHLRACDQMREYSSQCGAKIPQALRGTHLRKHIATKCINLNLTEGEMEDLANFMGHDPKIHKNIYPQPVLQTDIINIAKILNNAQGHEEHDSDENEEPEAEISLGDEPSTSSGANPRPRSSVQECTSRSLITACATPRKWTDQQRDVVLSSFGSHIKNGKMPTGKEMQQLIDTCECLKGRTVPQLRTWLHGQKTKLTR